MKTRDNLIKHTNIMMFAAVLAGFCNFLYQILMNRGLTGKDFADFYALLGLFVILSVPNMTIQTVVAKRISQLKAENNYAHISGIFFGTLKRILFAGTILLFLFILASSYLKNLLNISSIAPVIITGVALFSTLAMTVGYGTLQGLQKFTSPPSTKKKFTSLGLLGLVMNSIISAFDFKKFASPGLGMNFIISTLVRVISGFILVYLGFRTSGAIGSSIIYSGVAFGLAFLTLRPIFQEHSKQDEEIDFLKMYKYGLPVFLATLLISLLSFIDILLVKHFLAEEAANYSTASVLGRTIIYIPAAISMVLFPKVSEAEAKGENTSGILKKSFLYSLLLCLGASLVFFVLPEFIVRIFRSQYINTVPPLLKFFGFALIPLGLATILIYYNLALHRMKFLYGLTAGTILHIVLLSIFHTTLLQVIFVLGISGTIILGIMLITMALNNKEENG